MSTLTNQLPKTLDEFSKKLGNTSMMKVPTAPGMAEIYAKCEWENPTGSIKDRAAFAMLSQLLQEVPEENWKDLHILEYSGGNLGRSLARLCYELGINLTLVLGSFAGPTLLNELRSLNVSVELVDKSKGFWGVMSHAMELAEKRKDYYRFLYQHVNFANVNAHREGTGAEIVRQMGGRRVDAWVASIGTGGTLMGVYEALEAAYHNVELHLVCPEEQPYGRPEPPNGLPKYAGSGGLGDGRKQLFVERRESHLTKEWTQSLPATHVTMREFYEETGVKIGTSAAANLAIARQVAKTLGAGKTVVTVFPDAGSPEEWRAATQTQ